MTSFEWQSAVTSLCFSQNSEQIITASKDGSLRIWNINGMLCYSFKGVACLTICLLLLEDIGSTFIWGCPIIFVCYIYHLYGIV